jgi:hypothetical protein
VYCPSGTFALDSTRKCVSSCPKYYFTNYTLNVIQYQCVAECPDRTFLNASSHCVNATSCPAGYYGDPLAHVCTQNCPGNSTTQMFADTNPNVKLCVYICPYGYYRQNITNNRTCVNQCLPNYFIDYTNQLCVTTCPSGTFAYLNGSCLNRCPTGFYADPNSSMCNSTCNGGNFRDPTNSYCVAQCSPGYFGDVSGGYLCVKTCSVTT